MSVLAASSRRYLVRHPWQFGLSVLGVALGVAVVVAVDLANASARRAFEWSTESITGRATHRLVGGPSGLDETIYPYLVRDLGVHPAAPIVEGTVALAGEGGWTFHLLGLDTFVERPFRDTFGHLAIAGDDLTPFWTQPGQVLLTSGTAARLGLAVGDSFAVRHEGRRVAVTLAGLLRPQSGRARVGLESVLIADLATAQELLGQVGRLSRIDLILTDEQVATLAAKLPAGVRLVTAEARAEAMGEMTAAFNLNLAALGHLALMVGLFLIYNTMTFSVVQRRMLIGTLRAIGVTRRQVFAVILGEAFGVGLVGTLAGAAAGVVLAQGLLRLVTRTINDLYFVLSVRELQLDPKVLALAVGIGLLATLLAAVPAAYEATTAPPRVVLHRSSLETGLRRRLPRSLLVSALLLLAGGATLAVPSRSVGLGFVGLFGLVLGFAALTPGATRLLMALLRPPMGRLFGPVGRLAARGVTASLSRTGVAVAALAMAVSVTVGVGTMIASFRETVDFWLNASLQADVFVTGPRLVTNRSDVPIDPEIVRRLSRAAGVVSVATLREVELSTASGPLQLVALEPGLRSEVSYQFLGGDPERIWRAFRAGAVLLSEPFAYRRGLRVGERLTLPTGGGDVAFPVAGIYTEYGSAAGSVLVSRETYRRYWRDDAVTAMGLYLAPDLDPEQVVPRLRARLDERQQVYITSHRVLREESLRIFDRTFLITGVLRLLATGVAFIGVLSALMAIQLERARELAVLRAIGLTPAQLWGLVTAQTGLMGLAAGLLAMPVGYVLALVLIAIINRRSFGWTMPLHVEPQALLQALLLAVGAALLAGLYPAARMARVSPAEALREE